MQAPGAEKVNTGVGEGGGRGPGNWGSGIELPKRVDKDA